MVRKEIFHTKYTYVELHVDPSICADILNFKLQSRLIIYVHVIRKICLFCIHHGNPKNYLLDHIVVHTLYTILLSYFNIRKIIIHIQLLR